MSLAAALIRKSGFPQAGVVFGLLIPLAALMALGYLRLDLIGVVAVLIAVAFGLTLAWRTETAAAMVIAYFVLLPTPTWGEQFPFLPVYYYDELGLLLILALGLVYLLNRNADPSLRREPVGQTLDILGSLILAFLSWYYFQLLRGIGLGHEPFPLESEFNRITIYLSYFFWRGLFRWKGNIERWLLYLVGIGIVLALLFAFMVYSVFTDLVTFVVLRVITRQGQYLFLAIPLTATFMLTGRRWWQRLFFAGVLLLLFVHLFLTQQRMLWIAIAASSFLFLTLYSFRDGFTTRGFLRWLLLVLLMAALFAGVLYAAMIVLDADLDALLSRWEKVQTLSDPSFTLRLMDTENMLETLHEPYYWLIGRGGGVEMRSVPLGYSFYFFDFSYGVALWKGGLPLLLLLVSIYLIALWRAFRVFQLAPTRRMRMIGAAIVTALAGQMIGGFAEVSMLYFRHIFFWMMLAAAATVLYQNMRRKPDETAGVEAITAPGPER